MYLVNENKKEFFTRDEEQKNNLLEELAKVYFLSEQRTQRRKEFYYDTFDWRFYRKGYLIKRRAGIYYLLGIDEKLYHKAKAPASKHIYSKKFEDKEFRQVISKIAGIRAISEVAATLTERSVIDICNKDRKIVARLFFEKGIIKDKDLQGELKKIIKIEGLKGYEKSFAKASKICRKAGLVELSPKQSPLQRALVSLDKHIPDYSSKYKLSLSKDTSVKKAVSSICLYLLTAMEKNFSGVVKDIDSEFLHDFRIAIRRTRSLLSQMKKNLPEEEVIFFQNEFKWLGSLTGPVRDLDVYILMKEEFREILPEQLHSGLELFFDDMAKGRESKFNIMREGLFSSRYLDLMTSWKTFLQNEKEGADWKTGDLDCYPVALRILQKRYKKILRNGDKITNNSPDQDLHNLRIQGKKLRYLLEFFRSFLNDEDVDFFHKQLKKLQNNLGDFNDISVQIEMLENYRNNLKGRNKRSIKIAAAIGGLVAHLSNKQSAVRNRFKSIYAEFASEKNRNRFYSILS